MVTEKTLDKEINDYLPRLSSRQKETVLTVVKTFAEEDEVWNDNEFLSELDRRTSEYERGKVKPLTLDELEKRTRNSFKEKIAKKK
jgi:putative addiction module component (TIGR02574 family)